jgi:hypothetical protein
MALLKWQTPPWPALSPSQEDKQTAAKCLFLSPPSLYMAIIDLCCNEHGGSAKAALD